MFKKLLCKKLKIEELHLSSTITENKGEDFKSLALGTEKEPTTVKIINPQTPDRYLKLYCYNERDNSDDYYNTEMIVVETELVSPEKTIRETSFRTTLPRFPEKKLPLSKILKSAAKHCSKKGAAYTPIIMGIEALRKEIKKEEKRLDKLKEEFQKRKEQESLKQKLNAFISGERIR